MNAVSYFSDVMITKTTHKVIASYESQVSLASFGIPEVFGTLDASIIDLTAMHLDIFDWKFGSRGSGLCQRKSATNGICSWFY